MATRDEIQCCYQLRLGDVRHKLEAADLLFRSYPDTPLDGKCLQIIQGIRRRLDQMEHDSKRRTNQRVTA